MARVTNAILSSEFTSGYTAPMLDLRYGGEQGYAPNLSEWVSNQAYIQRPLIALLIEAPLGFRFMNDPTFWIAALKNLFETNAKSITGLNSSIEVDWGSENPVSGGGEMQQDFTDVKRQRSIPVFTWVEKYGRPIQTFLYEWITNLIADPDTKVANIATLGVGNQIDLLADMYSATVLFIEPDPTQRKVIKAWLCTNMAPKGTGDILGRRELSSAMENQELQIEFTALTSSNLGVRAFAQTVLNSINYTNANPNMQPSFVSALQADVVAAQGGYINQITGMSADAATTIAQSIGSQTTSVTTG
jgi:hypothetical protein